MLTRWLPSYQLLLLKKTIFGHFSIEFPLKSKQIRDSRSSGKKKIKKCSEISEQIGTI